VGSFCEEKRGREKGGFLSYRKGDEEERGERLPVLYCKGREEKRREKEYLRSAEKEEKEGGRVPPRAFFELT